MITGMVLFVGVVVGACLGAFGACLVVGNRLEPLQAQADELQRNTGMLLVMAGDLRAEYDAVRAERDALRVEMADFTQRREGAKSEADIDAETVLAQVMPGPWRAEEVAGAQFVYDTAVTPWVFGVPQGDPLFVVPADDGNHEAFHEAQKAVKAHNEALAVVRGLHGRAMEQAAGVVLKARMAVREHDAFLNGGRHG